MNSLAQNLAEAWSQRAMTLYQFLMKAEPAGMISADTAKALAEEYTACNQEAYKWQEQV